MGFRQNAYAKVWSVEDKGKYHSANISISRKDQETGEYRKEFNGFVRLLGKAHTQAQFLERGDIIKIIGCDVTNRYDKEKEKNYVNYLVYEFEQSSRKENMSFVEDGSELDDDENLPF